MHSTKMLHFGLIIAEKMALTRIYKRVSYIPLFKVSIGLDCHWYESIPVAVWLCAGLPAEKCKIHLMGNNIIVPFLVANSNETTQS
jgi:hypothetical protein